MRITCINQGNHGLLQAFNNIANFIKVINR